MESIAKLHSDEPDSYLYANNVYVDDSAKNPVSEEIAATSDKPDSSASDSDLPDFLQDLSEDELIKIE